MIAAPSLARAGVRLSASMLVAGALSGSLGCERRGEVAPSDSSEHALAPSIDFSTSLEGNVLSTRIDRERVLVGDPIRLIVIATPAADRVAELAMPESPLGAFDAVELPPPRDASLVPGSKVIALELSTFESGDLEIPSIRATFEPRGGGVEIELSSSPIPITVESVLEGEDLAGAGSAAAAVEAGVDPEDLRSVKGVVAGGSSAASVPPSWRLARVCCSFAGAVRRRSRRPALGRPSDSPHSPTHAGVAARMPPCGPTRPRSSAATSTAAAAFPPATSRRARSSTRSSESLDSPPRCA
ncbi:MAG: hypothetical protein RJA16_548 [Planctomycetota bacterium]